MGAFFVPLDALTAPCPLRETTRGWGSGSLVPWFLGSLVPSDSSADKLNESKHKNR